MKLFRLVETCLLFVVCGASVSLAGPAGDTTLVWERSLTHGATLLVRAKTVLAASPATQESHRMQAGLPASWRLSFPERASEYRFIFRTATGEEQEVWRDIVPDVESRPDLGEWLPLDAGVLDDSHILLVYREGQYVWAHIVPIGGRHQHDPYPHLPVAVATETDCGANLTSAIQFRDATVVIAIEEISDHARIASRVILEKQGEGLEWVKHSAEPATHPAS